MAQKKTQIDELGGCRTNMKANSVEEELEHLAKLVAELNLWELILGQKETTSPVGEVCPSLVHDYHDALMGFAMDVPLRRSLR